MTQESNTQQNTRVKQKILELLSKGPTSKSQIFNSLTRSLTNEKALQRLLAEMHSEGLILASGSTKGRIYSLPGPKKTLDSLMMPEKIGPEHIPTQKTFDGYRPYLNKYFSLEPSHRGWVGFDPTRISHYQVGSETLLSYKNLEILKSLPSWQKEKDIGSTYEHGAAIVFLHQFAFNSSRLEGAVLSLAETISFLNDKDDTSTDEKKIIVKNHAQAISSITKWILDQGYDFEGDLEKGSGPIKEIHQILMDGLLKDDSEGEVRRSEVIITGCAYIPSSQYEILETALHEIAIQSAKIKEPFERAFFLFAQIAYVQAFRDGNKRTARLISNVPLIAGKKAPHVFTEIADDDFNQAIVYFYETADSRPLEILWLQSYISGLNYFALAKESFAAANIGKAELSEVRRLAIAEIISHRLQLPEYDELVSRLLREQGLAGKYPKQAALSYLKKDIQKIFETGLGLRTYGLTSEQLLAWKASFKDRWF